MDEEIAAFEAAPTRLVETQIAFRGGPVTDDGGMDADFTGKALGAFTDAIAEVGISQVAAELDSRQRRLVRRSYEMVVRNTFRGSFGFQIEREFPYGVSPEGPDALESAIGGLKSILQASADSDEAAADAMAETDGRAMRSVHDFLDTMAKRGAYCAMRFKGDEFRFKNAAEVQQSASRVAPRKDEGVDKEMIAVFQGVLPEARRVEFVIEETGQTLVGEVANSVKDLPTTNDLGPLMMVRTRARQAGARKPVYTIMDWEPL